MPVYKTRIQSSPFISLARTKLIVWLVLLLAVGFGLACGFYFSSAAAETGKTARPALAGLSPNVTVRTQGQGNPQINLSDGREVLTDYEGPAELVQLLQQNQAQPLAMATADFDEDGVPDLVIGYAGAGSGIVSLLRGNVDAIYPNSPEAQQRKRAGTFTNAPFLSPALVYSVPQSPDFIGAGDFDGDGHWDVVAAARGNDKLFLLSGDGKGGLGLGREIELPGTVMAMTVGEINRRDGLDDVAVGINQASAAKVFVFEGSKGALHTEPEIIDLQTTVQPNGSFALALGQLDDDLAMDLAVAVGNQLWVYQGRDRKLSLDEMTRMTVAKPKMISSLMLRSDVKAITTGYFNKNDTKIFEIRSLALLLGEGSVYLHVWNKPKVDNYSTEMWPGAVNLINARVTGQDNDDLVIVGEDQLYIAMFDVDGKLGKGQPMMTEKPAAALPMRLNEDAMSDLVYLQEGRTGAGVVASRAVRTFIVDTIEDHLPDGQSDGSNGCDIGDCTLREAILQANKTPGLDKIEFKILTGKAPYTIKLQPIPNDTPFTAYQGNLVIRKPVTIDGATQPGYAGKPVIEIDYSNLTAPNDFGGITIYQTGDNVVRGLTMYTSRDLGIGMAIYIEGGYNSVIEGNYIGVDKEGSRRTGGGVGIYIANLNRNKFGGTAPAARNIISGHRINLWANTTVETLVQGNFIGTDDTGLKSVTHNAGYGMGVLFGGVNNTFGGMIPGARNVIFAGRPGLIHFVENENPHIWLYAGGGNIVQGNYIGPNAAGVGSGSDKYPDITGVIISASSKGNMIGGSVSRARNVISGGGKAGIQIFGEGSIGNYVQGNYIGVDATGKVRLSNGEGIRVGGTADTHILDNVISGNTQNGIKMDFEPEVTDPGGARFTFTNSTGVVAQRNLIGTDSEGKNRLRNDGHGILVVNRNLIHRIENNVIAFNGGAGVFIPGGDAPGFRIVISNNSIFDNVDIGIALNQPGGQGNDEKLNGKFANEGQNFPILESVTSDDVSTKIKGRLKDPPTNGFRIEIFSVTPDSPSVAGSKSGGACRREGTPMQCRVETAPNGAFTATCPAPAGGGFVNTTATSGYSGIGNTSEYSQCEQAKSADLSISFGNVIINPEGPPAAGSELTYTLKVANAGPTEAKNVTVTSRLSENATFTSITPPAGWTCQLASQLITCDAATMNSSGAAAQDFTVKLKIKPDVPEGARIVYAAKVVSSETPDPKDPGKEVTDEKIIGAPSADLALTINSSPDPVFAGDKLTYRLTVTNHGPSDAQGITLYANVPEHTTFVSSSPTRWASSLPPVGGRGEIVYRDGRLSPGQSAIFTIVVLVDPTTRSGTPISFAAEVLGSGYDPKTLNNKPQSPVMSATGADGPFIQEVTVTPEQITAVGLGFAAEVLVFIDGEPFLTPAAVEGSRRVTQQGRLRDGRSIAEAIPPGRAVRIKFRNKNGGQTEVPFKN